MIRLLVRTYARVRNRTLDRIGPEHRAGLFGMGWSTLAQVTVALIRLVSSLILTHLLAPEVYGVFGAAVAVLITLELFSDLGIRPTQIRHPEGTGPAYLGTGWLIGIGRAIVLGLIVAAIAHPVALVNGEPRLVPLLIALSLRSVLQALASPSLALLYRGLRYRELFILEVGQQAVNTAVSIWSASLLPAKYGAWAFLAGAYAGTCTYVTLSYLLTPRPPRPRWDRAAAREFSHLGWQIVLNTTIYSLWMHLDRLVGLRLVGDTLMGCYALAISISQVPELLLFRVCEIYFAMLSRQADPEARTRQHLLVSLRIAQTVVPLLGLGVLVAPLVILLPFDKRYAPAALPFALLLARLMLRTLDQVQFQFLMSRAEVYLNTRAYLVALVVEAALLVPMAWHFGIIGMAGCMLISNAALCLTQTLLLWRRGQSGLRPFVFVFGWVLAAVAGVFLLF